MSEEKERVNLSNDSLKKVNGGVVIGVGGSQGGGSGGLPTSATQAYVSLSNVNLNANTYLSLKDNSGSVVFSYKLPQTINQATICVSSPRLSKNTKASTKIHS